LTQDEPGEHPSDPTGPADNAASDIVTLRIRRVHLVGAILFVLGLFGGYLLFRLLDDDAVCRLPFTPAIGAGEGEVQNPASEVPEGPVDVSTAGRPALGPSDAQVVVVEFLDYECPFCKRHFDEVLPRLLDEYGDRIRYVVRNYPLTSIHPRSLDAAKAAECALEQDRYFAYHDKLFENQDHLEDADLIDYARDVDLQLEPFRECLGSDRTSDVIDNDLRDGVSYGVTATPTFFVNGERIVGAQSFDAFAAVIDRHLEE
jgi:protein-disulfide isomerase